MKIFNHILIHILIVFLFFIFNYLIIFNKEGIWREFYTVVFLFSIPGLLINNILHIKAKHPWESIIFIIGLSTSFLLFGGLIENFLLYAFGIIKPLETTPLLYFFDGLLSLLIVLHIFLYRNILVETEYISSISLTDLIFLVMSSLFPLLAICSAIMLNNGGSNFLTIILLCLIPITLLGLLVCDNKLHENTHYYYIFTSSISLLLMLSLRSWHISGWDINDEFRIFQMTKTSGYWNPLFAHAYNACLSLTILPTIISRFTDINDEYIYKLIFQLLFGLTPIAIYSFYRNFSTKIVSLLAVFYVIAQPFFIQPMTALIRQEIALFFFALTLSVIFSKSMKKPVANVLFILFGMSMIVSHYSTTYVSMGLFLCSFITIAIFYSFTQHTLIKRFLESIKSFKFNVSLNRNLQGVPLLVLIAFTYFWFFQFTQTSGNVTNVVMQTIQNFKNTFKEKPHNDETTKSLAVFSVKDANTLANIKAYTIIESQRFAKSAIPTYNSKPGDVPLYPVTNRSVPSHVSKSVNRWGNDILNIVKLITKIIIFLGPLLLLVKFLPKSSDKEYIILNTVGVALVVLVIVHPTLGEAYNLSRIYLHILFIAALGGVVCVLSIIPWIRTNLKILLVGCLFSVMFILFSGLSYQLIGGFSFMHLNNYGDDYDKFYTHDQEVYSAKWLASNSNKKQFIFTDDVSNLRLLSFGNISYALPIIIPSAMYKNSYVYARYANIMRLRTDADFSGVHLEYTFPMKFLDDNKNLVYNNGGSRIYR